MRGRVLIVDDDRTMCELLESALKRRDFSANSALASEQALAAIPQNEFDVIVTDLNMRGMNGIALCERVTANRPDLPVVVITAFGSLETAVAAIRAGAYDFVTKPFDMDELALILDRAVHYRTLREEVKSLRRRIAESQHFEELIGESPAMKSSFDLIAKAAESEASVLIGGGTGTGKELVARALHRRSRRKDGPFVAVNSAAVPEPLLESELFGHAKGAFTDARSERKGLFLEASGGTLFLDEICSMPPSLQPKLLRALQERRVRPVGGNSEVPVDVRIVAATNRDLEAAIHDGRFREDLYFRVNVIHIDLPPLRSRGNDVLLLAQHFLEHFAALSGKKIIGLAGPTATKLLNYAWPGNVRELQNCIERAVALTNYERITVDDLPERIRDYSASHVLVVSENPEELLPMEEVERRYVLRVLEAVSGNKTLAARILGFDRKTLYRKLERFIPGYRSNESQNGTA